MTIKMTLKDIFSFDNHVRTLLTLGELLLMTAERHGLVKSVRMDKSLVDSVIAKVGSRGFSKFVRKAVKARLGTTDQSVLSAEELDAVKGMTRQVRSIGTLLNQVTTRFNATAQQSGLSDELSLPEELAQRIDEIARISAQAASVIGEAQALLKRKGEDQK